MGTDAVIFNIQRYSIHDGPGIRTLVFFKGCSLRCCWCSNPEGIARAFQVRHKKASCVGCGRCYEACPEKAIVPLAANDFYVRGEICTGCGHCVSACLKGAKSMWGSVVSVDDLVKKTLRDMPFYESSGGGVTLSGGEPLLQSTAAAELLSKLRDNTVDTAIETAGHYRFSALEKVVPFCNTIHFDIKAWNERVHKELTGGNHALILENLSKLDALIGGMVDKPALVVRIPLLPEFNFQLADMGHLGAFLSTLNTLTTVEIMPFHNFGVTKYDDLGQAYPLRGYKNMHAEGIAAYLEALEKLGLPAIAHTW